MNILTLSKTTSPSNLDRSLYFPYSRGESYWNCNINKDEDDPHQVREAAKKIIFFLADSPLTPLALVDNPLLVDFPLEKSYFF